eukprot:gene6244-2866_t
MGLSAASLAIAITLFLGSTVNIRAQSNLTDDGSNCPVGADTVLDRMNFYRGLHGVPPLKWLASNVAMAQGYAETLILDNCGVGDSPASFNIRFGETIWMGRKFTNAPTDAWPCNIGVDHWYNQVNNYNFSMSPWADNKDNLDNVGMFTQLVWNATTGVGCYYAIQKEWPVNLDGVDYIGGCAVLVCYYSLAGNGASDQDFTDNVYPALTTLSPPPSPPPVPVINAGSGNSSKCTEGDKDLLDRMNAYRARSSSPPLKWDVDLVDYSKLWADAYSANRCAGATVAPARIPNVGQNVWLSSNISTDTTLTFQCFNVVDIWHNQLLNYKYTATPYTDNRVNFASTGFYTQLVWAASEYVGCYMSQPEPWVYPLTGESLYAHCMVLVCHFRKAGNVAGNSQYLDNVLLAAPAPPPPPAPPPERPPPPPPAPPPPIDFNNTGSNCPDGDTAIIEAINGHRARHNTVPLVWDYELLGAAKDWALNLSSDQCGGGTVRIEGIPGEAENIWMQVYFSTTPTSPYTCTSAVDSWYSRVGQYQFTQTPYDTNKANLGQLGTLTQMLWASTTRFGCYWSKAASWNVTYFANNYISQCNVVVCKFSPPGNNLTNAQYLANVKAPFAAPPPPPAPPSPPFSDDTSNCTKKDSGVISFVNGVRGTHASSLVSWDRTLVASAKTFANSIAARGCPAALAPSGTAGVGENIWAQKQAGMSVLDIGKYTCDTPLGLWYGQGMKYNFTQTPWTDNQGNFANLGSFTQLMWDSSTRIGCYFAQNQTFSTALGRVTEECNVFVCHFSPAGNRASNAQFLANVKPVYVAPPPSPPPPPSPAVEQRLKSANCPERDSKLLKVVNTYRADHGAPALEWDYSLVYTAREYSINLTDFCAAGTIPASGAPAVGENRFQSKFVSTNEGDSAVNCENAMSSWYSGGASYVYSNAPYVDNQANFQTIGLFSQLIWSSSTRVGCYFTKKSTPTVQTPPRFLQCGVIVCHFAEPGNVATNAAFLANVSPLSGADSGAH